MYKALMLILSLLWPSTDADCSSSHPSVTTVSGTHAPRATICPGDLIFNEDFDKFDLKIWNHEQTLSGGGNWEFQWYTNNRSNSYVENGILFIRPTLVADDHHANFLYSGTLDINGGSPADACTDPRFYGCTRIGNNHNILNPVKSARIRSFYSFAFKYGKVEVRAKLPNGDWLWPAIWLRPLDDQYSSWPASGEIDIMESRGNGHLIDKHGAHIGTQLIGSTLHWGPSPQTNRYRSTHYQKNKSDGFDGEFHRYQMEWTEDYLKFLVDDVEFGQVKPEDGGFWELGNFTHSHYHNPWTGGSKMAPFDQEFYLILNLACGGVSYFPDDVQNPGGKPWLNNSTRAMTDFWEGRSQWLPTWNGKQSAFQIDYVKVWAL